MTEAPAGARQAALVVHALPAEAQAAVLQRLDDGERALVEPLLAELAALGVPALPADRLQLLQQDATEPARAERLTAAAAAGALSGAGALAAALLLQSRSWQWDAEVMASLPSARREQVVQRRAAITPGAVPPAMAAWLVQRLLRQAPATPPRAAGAARLFRWLPWTR
jgi:hypothetical protein